MSEFVIAKIWFAFLGLQSRQEPLAIPRSKSTVITFHLQNITGVAVSELFQANFPESQFPTDITFEDYKSFLERDFIPKISAYFRQGGAAAGTTSSGGSVSEGEAQAAEQGKVARTKSSADQTLEEALETLALPSADDAVVKKAKKGGPSRPGAGPTKVFTWKYLEEYCWLIYLKGHLHHQPNILSQFAAFLFWTVFLTYARRENQSCTESRVPHLAAAACSGKVAVPVEMDVEELLHWLRRLQMRLGIAGLAHNFNFSEEKLSGTADFHTALSTLERFVDDNKLEPDVVEEALRDLRREIVKNVYKKARFHINPRPNADKQPTKGRLCKVYHNRIVLNHISTRSPDVKQQGKAIEPKRELYLPTWRIKAQEGDKSKRRIVLFLASSTKENPGEEIVLEAETSSVRNEWLTTIQMLINFKLEHPNQALPMELFNFLKRTAARDQRRREEIRKKLSLTASEKEKEEALQRLQFLEERWQDSEKEKLELSGQLQDMQTRLAAMNNNYNEIQHDYEEKEKSRQRLEQRLVELENEKDSTVESMRNRLDEMERIREEKSRIEVDIRATLIDKEMKLKEMESVSTALKEALEEERKARIMEAENARRYEALLHQEQQARSSMETLAQEKDSLLANEATRREEIERKFREEKEKVSRICHEKELLRTQNLEIKEQLNAKKKLLMKYPHLVELTSHRGPGFLTKKELMQLTVEQVVTVEAPEVIADELLKSGGDQVLTLSNSGQFATITALTTTLDTNQETGEVTLDSSRRSSHRSSSGTSSRNSSDRPSSGHVVFHHQVNG